MAKVISIVGTLSGKLAGTVYSHNRWGNYIRQLVIPTNPQSVEQQNQRGRIASAAADWSGLTDGQRLAWNAYAPLIVRLDRLGQPLTYNGFTAYVLVNTERSIVGQGPVSDPPNFWTGHQPDQILFNVTDGEMELTNVMQGGNSLVDTGNDHLVAFSCPIQAKGALYPKTWRKFYVSGLSEGFPIDLSASWEAKFGPMAAADDQRFFLRVVMIRRKDAPAGATEFYVSNPVDQTVLSTTT
jgi:hypothetical protein